MYYEEDLYLILSALTSLIPSLLLSVAAYVLTALALYKLSQRRGLGKPWLAWIPVANVWLIGSLSDQYQYLVKGRNKSRRKYLLILDILILVLSLTVLVLFGVMMAAAVLGGSESEILANIMGPTMAMLGVCVPLMGVAIAEIIIRYMALYDIYRSMDPDNSTLFLVLSILIPVTEPFFLFFSRNKDKGMPPRKQPEPVFIPSYVCDQGNPEQNARYDSSPNSWTPNDKDYL